MYKDFIIRNKIFTDPADYLKKVKFKAAVPISEFKIPDEIESGEIELSWLDDINPNELRQSYFTINQLINIFNKKLPFKIINNLDILKIYNYLNLYIITFDNLAKNNKVIEKKYKNTITSIKSFKICIEDIIKRISKIDPGIQDRLDKDKSNFDKILEQFL